jgi:hypothetical protein
MLILCAIFHFNLDEVEEKDWDDVFCYGVAQSWCLWWIGGISSIWASITWLFGVWASNCLPERFKLDWKYVELAQGFVIGAIVIM